MSELTRRSFLSLAPAFSFSSSRIFEFSSSPISSSRVLDFSSSNSGAATLSRGSFPFQARDLVREVVGASHGNLPRVKELIEAMPALARASWDWGFGDHEAAIDAASH